MTVLQVLAVLAAGFVAGGVNAIVGSGSLITFPVLLAVGFSSVTANVSNSVGLVFGNVSAALGYREELGGQRERAVLGGIGTGFGALTGGILLLTLPEGVFETVVPLLILLACALMVLAAETEAQPRRDEPPPQDRPAHHRFRGRRLRRLLRGGAGSDPAGRAALPHPRLAAAG